MWTGLLWSRAVLSVSMILFLTLSLVCYPMAAHLRHVRTHPYLLLTPILFLPPLISGAWSDDTAQWLRILQLKLPLLLLPLLCLPLTRIETRANRNLLYCMGLSLVISMGRSVLYFLRDVQEITNGYLQAKVLPVDIGNDHVRFGWLLSLVFLWGLHLLATGRVWAARDRRWLIALLILIFVFQHLLASKTGLAGMYFVLALCMVTMRRQPWVQRGAWILLAAPLAAWMLVPTFRNRAKFVWWDFQHYSRGAYTEGLSDTPRIISVKAGWELWKDNPWLGCGFGDLRRQIAEWYTRNTPQLKDYELLLPSNEFILHGAAGGLPAFLLFGIAVTAPLGIRRLRRSFAWIAFHVTALAGFLYDIALETQYGIFMYAFLGCWMYTLLSWPQEPIQDLPN